MYQNDFFNPSYTLKFADVWNSDEEFLNDYNNAGVGFYKDSNNNTKKPLTDESLNLLFSLLFANYGYSTIMNPNIDQFKYSVYSIIFMYGPAWQERLKLQRELINLSDDELREGTKAIYNHAFNPSTTPSTASIDELPFINEQNSSKYKKSKMDAISFKWDLLKLDVTKSFIERFKDLFIKVVGPYTPVEYITIKEDL